MNTTQRPSKDDYFLEMARLVAKRATCPRRAVGCVITNQYGHVMSTGYNGVPINYAHCITSPCGGQGGASSKGLDKCMATHAEQNALLQCPNVMEINTIYCTTSPCITCAKLIGNTSCKRVVCDELYSDHSGIKLLMTLGISVQHKEITLEPENYGIYN